MQMISDPKAICDRCGLQRTVSTLREEWTGLRVCRDCWEPRNTQEFVRGRGIDRVPFAVKSVGPYQFLGPTDVSAEDL